MSCERSRPGQGPVKARFGDLTALGGLYAGKVRQGGFFGGAGRRVTSMMKDV